MFLETLNGSFNFQLIKILKGFLKQSDEGGWGLLLDHDLTNRLNKISLDGF